MAFGQGSVSIDTAKVMSTASTIKNLSTKIQGLSHALFTF